MRLWTVNVMLALLLLVGARDVYAQTRDASVSATVTTAGTDASVSQPMTAADASATLPVGLSSADAGAPLTGEQYVVRIHDLEQRVNELKEDIFKTKARLSLLAEAVIDRLVGGSRAIIRQENKMSGAFRLVRAVYALDGAPIVTRVDDHGSLADQREFPVFDGPVPSGDHVLSVTLELQGTGYGLMPYAGGYSFKVRSSQSFTVSEGKAIQLRVTAFEKNGPTAPPEERPAVEFRQQITTLREASATAEADAGTSGGTP